MADPASFRLATLQLNVAFNEIDLDLLQVFLYEEPSLYF